MHKPHNHHEASREDMFSYKRVEAAVQSLHDVPTDKNAVFRSRVREFQRKGIIPSAPGKGIRPVYSEAEAMTWVVCFELAELGLLPLDIRHWAPTLVGLIMKTARKSLEKDNLILWVRPDVFSRYLNLGPEFPHQVCGATPALRVSEIFLKEGETRVMMLNISDLWRRLKAALENAAG